MVREPVEEHIPDAPDFISPKEVEPLADEEEVHFVGEKCVTGSCNVRVGGIPALNCQTSSKMRSS